MFCIVNHNLCMGIFSLLWVHAYHQIIEYLYGLTARTSLGIVRFYNRQANKKHTPV